MLTIPVVVHPLRHSLIGDRLICTDDLRFTRQIDAGLSIPSLKWYTYTWFFGNNLILMKQIIYFKCLTEEELFIKW
jgi:hypothetical protein